MPRRLAVVISHPPGCSGMPSSGQSSSAERNNTYSRSGYMPKPWGRVSRTEMDVRPGGIFSIDIAMADGQDFPNLGCFLEAIPMERLVWTSMLFPGYRPAVFDDIPITAIITMESVGTGTRYVFTALHRDEADFEKNEATGWQQGTEIAL